METAEVRTDTYSRINLTSRHWSQRVEQPL
jgi:hypothetical protein